MDEAVFVNTCVHRKTLCRLVAASAVGLDMPTNVFIARRRAILALARAGLGGFDRRRIYDIHPALGDDDVFSLQLPIDLSQQ